MFTLVVFTLVVGATTSGAFTNAFNDLERLRRRLRRSRHDVAGPADREHAAAVARTPGLRRNDFTRHLERVVAAREGAPARRRREGGVLRRQRRRRRLPLAHDVQARRPRPRLRLEQGGLAALRTHPNLAVVDQFVVPRKENWNFAIVADVPAARGSTSRTRPSTRSRSTVRDQQTGKQRDADRDRRPLRQRAASSWAGSGLPSARSRRSSATACCRRSTSSRWQPGVDAKTTAQRLESAFLSNGMQADSLEDRCTTSSRRT